MIAVATLLATALLVASEVRGSRLGIWLTKPLASCGFIASAWTLGIDGAADHYLLAALCACALGDMLLIPRDERAFLAGVGSFGLGHALYGVAFALHGVEPITGAISIAVLAGLATFVFRWLAPGVPPALKPAVVGYCTIIALMAAIAFATTAATGDLRVAAGATMFFVSDLSVARDKFVAPSVINRVWGLPLYYVAQLTLASTAA